MNLISLVCPECGAQLKIENDRKQCFCQYCGTQIVFDDGSKTYVFRKIDEARIKEAAVKELIRLKELEAAERKDKEIEEAKKKCAKTCKILAIIGTLISVLGVLGGEIMRSDGLYTVSLIGFFFLLAIPFIWMSNC